MPKVKMLLHCLIRSSNLNSSTSPGAVREFKNRGIKGGANSSNAKIEYSSSNGSTLSNNSKKHNSGNRAPINNSNFEVLQGSHNNANVKYSSHSSYYSLSSPNQGMRYKCEICRTLFVTKDDLLDHIGKETTLTNPHWPCMELASGEEICLRVFSSQKGRDVHKISHEKDSIRDVAF